MYHVLVPHIPYVCIVEHCVEHLPQKECVLYIWIVASTLWVLHSAMLIKHYTTIVSNKRDSYALSTFININIQR